MSKIMRSTYPSMNSWRWCKNEKPYERFSSRVFLLKNNDVENVQKSFWLSNFTLLLPKIYKHFNSLKIYCQTWDMNSNKFLISFQAITSFSRRQWSDGNMFFTHDDEPIELAFLLNSFHFERFIRIYLTLSEISRRNWRKFWGNSYKQNFLGVGIGKQIRQLRMIHKNRSTVSFTFING